MPLKEYRRKRKFSRTPEPKGAAPIAERAAARSAVGGSTAAKGARFVIQKHAASRLHYDLRLEMDGVYKSWAVPKGPSLDPKEKRLAIEVEDHPLEYGEFEGTIPAGEYGGGTVLIWDRGEWTPDGDPSEAHRRGKLTFRLEGEKLAGAWSLVRLADGGRGDAKNWLWMKRADKAGVPASETDITDRQLSVASGRSMDQIAAGKPGPRSAATQRKTAVGKPAATNAGRRAAMPEKIELQLATLAANAPDGAEWLHEIKFDGYRMLCRIQKGQATLVTRGGLDWTARAPAIAKAAAALPATTAILDGELVAMLTSGESNFQALQQALKDQTTRLTYQAFDLLYLDGTDLRTLPLSERKARLHALLKSAPASGPLRYTEYLEGDGPAFLKECCKLGLEGTISKRGDRPYLGGRRTDWLKVKCLQREEFVIGGYTPPVGGRAGLGALLVGHYDERRRLVYAGKVGTGFTQRTLADLLSLLKPLAQTQSPFADFPPRGARAGVHFVRPQLVAQVQFANWTNDHRLRHASFQGLREDKPAGEVLLANGAATRETRSRPKRQVAPPVDLSKYRLTNPQRVLYAEEGLTKRDLAEYYAQVADWILPHVSGRPLALVRCPEGKDGPCFFQKHAAAGTPDALRRVEIAEKGKLVTHLSIEDVAGLIAVAQMSVLEIHPWQSRTDDVEKPDRVIVDLDPDPSVPWKRVKDAALDVRRLLAELGLQSFVKTTGGKGLHVVAPIQRRHGWDEVKACCKAFAQGLAASHPGAYTANVAKAARKGKIYVDYLRNQRGATAIAAYSPRSRGGAPVGVPLTWKELESLDSPGQFSMQTVPARLAALRQDPWAEMATLNQTLTAAMRKLRR